MHKNYSSYKRYASTLRFTGAAGKSNEICPWMKLLLSTPPTFLRQHAVNLSHLRQFEIKAKTEIFSFPIENKVIAYTHLTPQNKQISPSGG